MFHPHVIYQLTNPAMGRPKALILDKWANLHQEGDLVLSLCQVKRGSPKIRFMHRFRPVLTRTTSSIIGQHGAGGICYCWLKTGRGERERSKGRSVWCIWDGSKSGREGTSGRDGSETSL